ncbi:MAG: RNA polymerase sigma factor [Alphaproteobacteria bacterium]|nr:RNA polymerase sigma factor [Alphaproteobacteria bacterium]
MADEKTNQHCKNLVRSVVRKMLYRNDEDVEQEIYIRLWEKYPNYKEQNKLWAWVRTVAENYCRDYLKNKSQKLLAASIDEESGILETISTEDDPERAWLLKCRQKIILQAVNELPKEMKQAIILVEFDGLSYERAAAKMKINVGTLKSRLHNAKAKLHDKLAYLEL